MSRSRSSAGALALAAALLSACEVRVGGAPSSAALDLCRTATARVHAALAACEGATGPKLQAWKASDEAFCTALALRVSLGRARVDADRAQRCTAALTAVSCADAAAAGAAPAGALGTAACDGAVAGVLAPGEACLDDLECGAGLFCSAGFSGTCPGTCAPLGGAGERCDDRPCGAGLACDFGATGACQPASDPGAPCPCAAGAYCDRSGGGSVCRAQKGAGTACAGPSECASGLVCAGAPATCQPFSGAGASCTPIAAGCAPGLACLPSTARCEAAPTFGAPCLVSVNATTYTLPCVDGFCDAAGTRTCQPFKADGQTCKLDVECKGFCDAAASVCAGGSGLTCPTR